MGTYGKMSIQDSHLFEDETSKKEIGKCPRCNHSVNEGKKNYYCSNRSCQFVMWKDDKFFQKKKKVLTPEVAAALLKKGHVEMKNLYSEKTGKSYDAFIFLADTGEKYVNYRIEFGKAK